MEKEKKRNITLRLTEEEIEWLKHRAQKEVRPLAGVVRLAIREYRLNHQADH